VVAYGTSRRRSEIGVRLALGAAPRSVIAMVMRDGLTTAILGILAGLPVVWLGSKYVAKELFHMKALDPLSLVLTTGILLAAAAAATAIPALRASALQPSETLRQE
jgi:ABC-type antimicrobial peptide transport system permease subunit